MFGQGQGGADELPPGSADRSQLLPQEWRLFDVCCEDLLLRRTAEAPAGSGHGADARKKQAEKNQKYRGNRRQIQGYSGRGLFKIVQLEAFAGFNDEDRGTLLNHFTGMFDKMPKTFVPPEMAGLQSPYKLSYAVLNPVRLK